MEYPQFDHIMHYIPTHQICTNDKQASGANNKEKKKLSYIKIMKSIEES